MHIYGAIWSPSMVQFFVDDPTKVFLVETATDIGAGQTWEFNHPFFLIMNLAIGGAGSWPGVFDSTTPNPSVMTVDYVRIYQAAAVPAPNFGNPTGLPVHAGATSGNTTSVSAENTLGSGRVYFACTTTAPKASCQVNTGDSLNVNTVDFSATAAATVGVSVATTANAILPPMGPWWRILGLAAAVLAVLLGMVAFGRGRRLRPAYALGAILLLCGGLWLGCGNSSGSTPTPSLPNGTTPGNYTLTVDAYTLTGSGIAPDATVNIPLTVN